MNNQYDTLLEATRELEKKGYKIDFILGSDSIENKAENKKYKPEEFHIDEYHRFEGMSNPDDMSIIFAVTTSDGKKGVIIDAYGANEDAPSAEMIKKLRIE